ncbi:MAG: SRPBCC family protein [bacterium]|nr:SRPBCC family protein [bacterium]
MAPGRFEVDVEHTYEAPPDVVWRVYTDHARWSEWAGLPGSHLIVEGSPDKNGAGCVRGFAARTREEILTFEPPKRMTYSVIAGLMPMKNHLGEVTLEPQGEGTRLRWRCRFDSKVPGLGGLMQRGIARTFAGVLRRLEARGFD